MVERIKCQYCNKSMGKTTIYKHLKLNRCKNFKKERKYIYENDVDCVIVTFE